MDMQKHYRGQLDAFISSIGRGGVKIAAANLGVSPGMVYHYRTGTRPITPEKQALIDRFILGERYETAPPPEQTPVFATTRTAPPQQEPAPMLDQTDDAEQDVGNISIPRDIEELEQQVIAAETAEVFELIDEAPAYERRKSMSETSTDDFFTGVWLPMHESAAGMLSPAHGDALIDHCQSGIGKQAAKAACRTSDRLGISKHLQNGHWSADLGIMVIYFMGCKQAILSASMERVA